MVFWAIFKHSLKLVTNNKNAVLKITLPFLIATLFLHALMIFNAATNLFDSNVFSKLILLAYAAVAFVSYPWIAVAWHRYILIDEYPGNLPIFHGKTILLYMLTGTLIGLVLISSILPFLLFSMITTEAYALMFAVTLATAVGIITASVVMMRLSTALPGVALGNTASFRDVWNVTRGHTKTFVGLILMLFVANAPIHIISLILLNSPFPIISILWDTISGFAIVMIGLSVITTQYGYFVEKRSLQE